MLPNQTFESTVSTKKFWRVDTKALVGAILIGVVFVLAQQVAHRIDNMIFPGLLIIGGVSWATFTGFVAYLLRQPAGVIMGETQALIAIASGLSPLAVFFIPANGLGSIAFSISSSMFSMEKWYHFLLAQAATNITGNICTGLGMYYILNLPVPVVLGLSILTAAVGTAGGTAATIYISRLIERAGLTI
ncbi:hypothetical protein [Natranaerofaba carboxydovora]|uniref:hypothetical protein n=1 Tax=Natranaerofaba carboxydovora TaxID=2742683 RepID=UPI001F132E22|nr:hypothetical protein [Natranaerofaba carboxydovora]UMZ73781.1 hypothetical protein ACONDI_01350 [Natranaerofaba carboxydovora]